jgi:hypothetical protein
LDVGMAEAGESGQAWKKISLRVVLTGAAGRGSRTESGNWLLAFVGIRIV